MKIFSSYKNMLDRLDEFGYIKTITPRGVHYDLDGSVGIGTLESWGDGVKFVFNDLDVIYHETQLILNYSDIKGVQMTFIEPNDMDYYKDEDEKERTHFGSFFYVNNVSIPWFKEYKAGDKVRALSIIISEAFLIEHGFHLSEEEWNRFARVINLRGVSLPSITAILKQIRYATISDELFERYMETKMLEAFLILWDFSKQKNDLKRLNAKSHLAVKEALTILSKEYVNPPIITDLAKMVGIDKKTLQFAFAEIVGMSIHKYIRTLKMQKSLELLRDTDLTIENIAKEVGYQSKIHFYKAFEDVFSMKPLEMRKLL